VNRRRAGGAYQKKNGLARLLDCRKPATFWKEPSLGTKAVQSKTAFQGGNFAKMRTTSWTAPAERERRRRFPQGRLIFFDMCPAPAEPVFSACADASQWILFFVFHGSNQGRIGVKKMRASEDFA